MREPEVAATIDGVNYYTVEAIADAIGTAPRNIVSAVRAGQMGGRKIGTQYIIAGPEFHRWITEGRFDFKSRTRKKTAK